MTPMITLYILAGCVALAAAIFVVMIIATALRPPELPRIGMDMPPPIERMVRALTPPPFATVAPVMRSPVAAAAPVAAPASVAPAAPAASAMRSAVPAVAPAMRAPVPAVAPVVSPAVVSAAPVTRPPIVLPLVPPPAPAIARARPILPLYPVRRGRKLLRVTLVLFALAVVAAGSVVAYPAMLDPLADDYEWFGADTVSVLREQARIAHDAIAAFVADW